MLMPGQRGGGGSSLTRVMERRTVNFNLCSDPAACRCEVTGEVVFGQSCGQSACLAEIVAGQEPVLRVAELRLTNSGVEPAPTALLEVRLDHAGYRLDRLEGTNCETGGGQNFTQCYLFLPNNTQTNLPLYISTTGAGAGDVGHLTFSVSVRTDCQGRSETPVQREFQIPLVQRWELRPTQDRSQETEEFYWNEEEDNEDIQPVSLDYAITNTGPSSSSQADVLVFIPRDSLLENTAITLDSQPCSAADFDQVARFPYPATQAGDITCRVGSTGSCSLYHCPVSASLRRSERKVVKVSYDFNRKKAEQRGEQTKFVVRTSLCVLKRSEFQPDNIVCDAGNTTVATTTVFQYFKASPLDILINYWQIVVGVAAAIIVFIVILLLFWKCGLFQKARVIKNADEEEETEENQQLEMEEKK